MKSLKDKETMESKEKEGKMDAKTKQFILTLGFALIGTAIFGLKPIVDNFVFKHPC